MTGCRRRIGIATAIVAMSMPGHAAAGDLGFARPNDPLFRALFPTIDTNTGITPVAEPAIARGRGRARAGCGAGFRIGEPSAISWDPWGATITIAVFKVTAAGPDGGGSQCDEPEPWACVLERPADYRPIDCVRIEQSFVPVPGPLYSDPTVYRLTPRELALGVRVLAETASGSTQRTDEALVVFRFQDRQLIPVLKVPLRRAEVSLSDGSRCAHTLFLQAEPTQTLGFFDWRLRTVQRPARPSCAIDPDPSAVFGWNGREYVAR